MGIIVSLEVKSFSWSRGLLNGLLVAGIGILLGCGGGGGGVSGDSSNLAPGQCSVATGLGNVSYQTVWGSAPANASQVIQIIDADGFVLRSDSVNRNGTLFSDMTLTNLAAGVHVLKATIYNQANAGGGAIGELTQVVDLCSGGTAGTTYTATSRYGIAPTELKVVPGSGSVKEQSITQFVSTGLNGGQAVFLPVGDLRWSVVGGIGTVGATTGQFTATTVGSGAVRAASTAHSLSKSADVDVTQRTTTQGKWTVLVYLNAANDLFSFSTLNVNQMEQVAGNPDVRFVVQWKQSKSAFGGSSFDGVRRYLVKPDTTSAIASELVQNNIRDANGNALDMGSTQTLADFIEWGKENYPADRYVLILWNHGNGWKRSTESLTTRAFSYDDQYGTSIKSWETDAALAGNYFDIIAWDASLMQMMEVAYEVRGFADYVVGSEESPPGEGYPYHLIFDEFRDNPNASSLNLARAFVDGMQEQAQPGNLYQFRKITQSVVSSSQLNNVATSLSALADQLITHRLAIAGQIQTIRNTAQSYSPASTRVYRDIVDVCFRLEGDLTIPQSVRTAASNVRTAIAQAVVYEYSNAESPNSHGLSIDFSDTSTYATFRTDYERMKLAQDTNWNEWLGLAP